MTKSKIILPLFLLISLQMTLISAEDPGEMNPINHKQKTQKQNSNLNSDCNYQDFMYIQQSQKAILKDDPNHFGRYILELSNNDKSLIYFAEKPNKVAGVLSLGQFLKVWQNSSALKKKPPTGVISFSNFQSTSESGVTVDILELYNPVYNSSRDVLTINAKPLHNYRLRVGMFQEVVIVYEGFDCDCACFTFLQSVNH